MLENLRINKILWSIILILTLIVSLAGVIDPGIYAKIIRLEMMPAVTPQDYLTVTISIALLFLIALTKEKDAKKQIIIIGVIASFFYLYGIFTIERLYNWFYLVYLAIFTLSFWSTVYSVKNIKRGFLEKVRITKGIKWTSIVVSLATSLIFTIAWITMLVPLMRTGNQIDYLYSIFILDLWFVMPAFAITAIMAIKNNELGVMLLPAMFIMGFFVIFPLGLAEIFKPLYGQAVNLGAMFMSFGLSGLYIILCLIFLAKIKMEN